MPAPTVLIIGASRGLGASLAKKYATEGAKVLATSRGQPKETIHPSITWIPSIDIANSTAGGALVSALSSHSIKSLSTTIITAGLFHLEPSLKPNFDQQAAMYATCAIGPTCLVAALADADFLSHGSKVVLISSESGSIALRDPSEGGGAYGHHASKSALNMCGKLLSLDLRDRGVAVSMLHPGFMRTDMTAGVGFDKFWDEGGAVTPDEAADSLVPFIRDRVSMESTGQYWAPRGAADIGTAEAVLGPKNSLPTPLQLPW